MIGGASRFHARWDGTEYAVYDDAHTVIPDIGTYKPTSTLVGTDGLYSTAPVDVAALDQTYKDDVITLGVSTGFTSATTLTGKLFGRIVNNDSGWVLQSCAMQGLIGESLSTDTALVDCNASNAGTLTLNDCALIVQPGAENQWLDCIIGHDYTLWRCEGSGGVDIMGSYNSHNSGGPVNASAHGCYFHDYCGFLVTTEHSNGPSHNDCWQHQGGSNVGLYGCNLIGSVSPTLGDGGSWSGNTTFSNPAILDGLTGNSAIQINTNTGSVTGFTVQDCWLDGGYITINGGTTTITATLDNVRFGRNQGAQESGGNTTATAFFKTGSTLIRTGLVYDDTGAPIDVRFN